jgi:DNA-binding beta-propeller fold protein YncE
MRPTNSKKLIAVLAIPIMVIVVSSIVGIEIGQMYRPMILYKLRTNQPLYHGTAYLDPNTDTLFITRDFSVCISSNDHILAHLANPPVAIDPDITKLILVNEQNANNYLPTNMFTVSPSFYKEYKITSLPSQLSIKQYYALHSGSNGFRDMAIKDKVIYLASSNGSIAVLNRPNNKIITNIEIGSPINALAINEKTDMIYTGGINVVYIIDGSINKLKTTVADLKFSPSVSDRSLIQRGLDNLAVNSATNTIYAASSLSSSIAVINGSNNKIITNIEIGSPINALAINEKTNTVYATPSQPADTIYVIDGSHNEVIDKIKVIGTIQNILISPENGVLFVITTHPDSIQKYSITTYLDRTFYNMQNYIRLKY